MTLGLYDNTATNMEQTKLCDHTFVNRRGNQSQPNMIHHHFRCACSTLSKVNVISSAPSWVTRVTWSGPRRNSTLSSVQHFTSPQVRYLASPRYGTSRPKSTSLHTPLSRSLQTPISTILHTPLSRSLKTPISTILMHVTSHPLR